MKYIVRSREDLVMLKNPNLKMSLRSITLESNSVQNARIEKKLNRYYFACGCKSGSVCVLITLMVSVIVGFMYGFHGILIWWKIIIYLAIAAIAGKSIGLLWSHLQLRKIYKLLASLLPPKAHLISAH